MNRYPKEFPPSDDGIKIVCTKHEGYKTYHFARWNEQKIQWDLLSMLGCVVPLEIVQFWIDAPELDDWIELSPTCKGT